MCILSLHARKPSPTACRYHDKSHTSATVVAQADNLEVRVARSHVLTFEAEFDTASWDAWAALTGWRLVDLNGVLATTGTPASFCRSTEFCLLKEARSGQGDRQSST